jgi:mitochondrial fission protein ELM1
MSTVSESLLLSLVKNLNETMAPGVVQMIDDTVEHTGPYFAIAALEDSVIDTSECTTNITDAAATISIPKGMTIYGNFTSIELDSGKVLAYARTGVTPS